MSDQNWLDAARFKKFSLRTPGFSVLPEGHGLVVDRLTGTITLVKDEQAIDVCNGLREEQFTLVLYLLETWPSYALYEEMLSQIGVKPTTQQREDFARIRVSMVAGEAGEQDAIERARERVQPLLQTLRDILSGCKASLNSLGVNVAAVLNYGWIIVEHVA